MWDSAFTPRKLSDIRVHLQLVVAMGCRNVTHTDVPIADWALVSLDQMRPMMATDTACFSNGFPAYIELLRAKAWDEKHQTHWRVLLFSRADYDFDGAWHAWLLRIGQ